MMDYEKMWNELKEKVQNDLEKNTDLAWGFIYKGFQEWMKKIEDNNFEEVFKL